MKKSFLRTISLVCSVVLLATSLFTGSYLTAFAEPGEVATSIQFAKADGTSEASGSGMFESGTTWNNSRTFRDRSGGSSYLQQLRLVLSRTQTGMTDFTGYDNITFQFYYAADQEAALEGFWRRTMQIAIKDTNSKFAWYPLPVGLVAGQYNTITLDLKYAQERGVDISSLEQIWVKSLRWSKWRDGDTSQDNGCTTVPLEGCESFTFKVTNFCANILEEDPNRKLIAGGRYRYWGADSNTFAYADCKGNLLESVNASGYDYLEYDLYFSDVDGIRAKLGTDGKAMWTHARFMLYTSTGQSGTSCVTNYVYPADSLHDGYNHFKINLSDINSEVCANIASFRFYFERYSAAVSFDSSIFETYVIGIANIELTKFVEEVEPEPVSVQFAKANGTAEASGSGMFESGTVWTNSRTFQDRSGGNSFYQQLRLILSRTQTAMTDFTGYDNITFQFYYAADQAAALEGFWRRTIKLAIKDTSGNFAWYPLPTDLVPGEYNTITLDLDYATSRGVDISNLEQIWVKASRWGSYWRDGDKSQDNGCTTVPLEGCEKFTFSVTNFCANTVKHDKNKNVVHPGSYYFWGGDSTATLQWADRKGNLATSVDMNEYDFLEYDLFISDVEGLRAKLGNDGNTLWTHARLKLYTGANQSGSECIANLIYPSDNLHNGYNHFKIRVTDLDSAVRSNFASYNFYFERNNQSVSFDSSIFETYVLGITDITLSVSEIRYPPEYPDYATYEISQSGRQTTWGTYFSDTQNRLFVNLTNSPVDITGAKRVEFDLFIEDLESFQSVAADKSLRFVLSSDSSDKTANSYVYNIYDKITTEGWNHIVIDDISDYYTSIGTFDPSSVNWAYVVFWNGVGVSNPIANTPVRLVNICASKEIDLLPEYPSRDTIEIDKAGLKNNWKAKFSYIADEFYLNFSSDPLDLGDADIIEFDIYIEDQAAFHSAFDSKSLRFCIASGSDRLKNRRSFNFVSQITKDGWNHIVINMEDYASTDSTNRSSIKWIGFACWSNTEVENPLANVYTRMVNFGAYTKLINILPEYPDYASVELNKDGLNKNWKAQFNYIQDEFYIDLSASPVDISNAEQIEFDIYIEDQEAFHNAFDGKSLRFYIASGSTRAKNRRTFNFVQQITKDGWNHIILDVPTYVATDSTDRSSIKWIGFACWGSNLTSANPLSAVYTRMVNFCAVEDNRVIASLGDIEVSGTYKDNYKLSLAGTAAAPVDMTASTSFDFDLYVQDYNMFVESFKTDANGLPVAVSLNFGIATKSTFSNSSSSGANGYYQWGGFQDQVTKTGWNHISLPYATCIMSSGSYTVNDVSVPTLSGIQSFRLWYGGDSYKEDPYVNLIGSHTATIKNLGGGIDPIPTINVGSNQTEAYIHWLVGSSDYSGTVMLKEAGSRDVYTFDAYEHSASEVEPYYYSRAKITDLKANTNYLYSVGYAGVWSDWYSLSVKGFSNNFSFVQVSDIQLSGNASHLNNWTKTLSRINEYFPNTSFIMNTGDVSDSSSKLNYYVRYKSPKLLKNYITSVVPGNHDSTAANAPYDENFTTPETRQIHAGNGTNACDYWYSYNNVLFICLASTISDIPYHEAFVRKVVAEQGDKFTWKIVQCHFSLFSGSYHNNEGNVVAQRNTLAPVFSELGIDMVLSGHDHKYLRSYIMNGTTPVVSNKSYTGNTNGGVQYISCTSGSALKFNNSESDQARTADHSAYTAFYLGDYSADQVYGFMTYDVTDYSITLTHYSSADMSVIDTFTIYKVNTGHMSTFRSRVLTNQTSSAVDYNSDSSKDIRDYVRLKKWFANVA